MSCTQLGLGVTIRHTHFSVSQVLYSSGGERQTSKQIYQWNKQDFDYCYEGDLVNCTIKK